MPDEEKETQEEREHIEEYCDTHQEPDEMGLYVRRCFYKKKPTDEIWVVCYLDYENGECHGAHKCGPHFSFDKKHVFGHKLYKKLTPEQKEKFRKYDPYWADRFEGKI